jgi:site-specific DNA recombinase
MYEDKLDGKIDEEFWTRKMADWHTRKRALQGAADALNEPVSDQHVLSAQRTLELANKAHFLYLARNHGEQGQLLKMVLLNCATDGVTVTPTYRKPFDLIFQRAKNEEWSGRADLNCRPLAPQASALPG